MRQQEAPSGDRTHDRTLTKRMLYQLSYRGYCIYAMLGCIAKQFFFSHTSIRGCNGERSTVGTGSSIHKPRKTFPQTRLQIQKCPPHECLYIAYPVLGKVRKSIMTMANAILFTTMHMTPSIAKSAHAGSRTRVTSMGGLYDTATLHALMQ